jgi:hypothetical protein
VCPAATVERCAGRQCRRQKISSRLIHVPSPQSPTSLRCALLHGNAARRLREAGSPLRLPGL